MKKYTSPKITLIRLSARQTFLASSMQIREEVGDSEEYNNKFYKRFPWETVVGE